MSNSVSTTIAESERRTITRIGTNSVQTSAQGITGIWSLLRFVYSAVPVVAGVDKFTNLLTNWESYLNPLATRILPWSGHAIMRIAGVIEIAAGTLVFARPRLGAYIVSAWLAAIALSLIMSGTYFDVAVRDLVMAIGAYSLAKLTPIVETHAKSRT